MEHDNTSSVNLLSFIGYNKKVVSGFLRIFQSFQSYYYKIPLFICPFLRNLSFEMLSFQDKQKKGAEKYRSYSQYNNHLVTLNN